MEEVDEENRDVKGNCHAGELGWKFYLTPFVF